MKLYITGAIALLSVLLIVVTAAPAAEKDALYTDTLETIFTDMMNKSEANIEQRGATLRKTGTIDIEKADGYYAVTLPEMAVVEKNGDTTNIGMIAVNATPTKDITNWKMAVALPMPIQKTSQSGQKLSQLDIAKQQFVGVYNDKIDNFSILDISYDDITMSNYVDNQITSAKNMRLTSDLSVNDETLSGPSEVVISDIAFSDADTGKTTTVGEIDMEVVYDDIDLLSIAQNTQGFDLKKLGGIKLKGQAKNITSDIQVSKIDFEFEGEKPEDGLSDQTLKISYNGLTTKDIRSNMAQFVPADMTIDFDLNDLPLTEIIRLGQMKLGTNENNPAAALNMLQSLTSLPTKMAKAGSHLDIEHIDFKNALYDITTRGKLKASDTSPIKVVGDIVMNAKGLDKTEAAIQTKMTSSSAQEVNALQKMLGQINFIKSNCAGDKGDYKCNLNFSDNGKISLNKKQLSIFDAMKLMQ